MINEPSWMPPPGYDFPLLKDGQHRRAFQAPVAPVRWGSTGGAISDPDRLLMINEPWMPPPGYDFPLLKDGQHRRAFQAPVAPVRWGSTGGAISDQDRLLMINEPWMPPPGYDFPLLKDGQHRRAFQAKWLQLYPWARYSPSHQGVFCVACVLFGQDETMRARQVLRMLVSEPINRFKKGLHHLNDHGTKTYHKVRTKNIRINRNC